MASLNFMTNNMHYTVSPLYPVHWPKLTNDDFQNLQNITLNSLLIRATISIPKAVVCITSHFLALRYCEQNRQRVDSIRSLILQVRQWRGSRIGSFVCNDMVRYIWDMEMPEFPCLGARGFKKQRGRLTYFEVNEFSEYISFPTKGNCKNINIFKQKVGIFHEMTYPRSGKYKIEFRDERKNIFPEG